MSTFFKHIKLHEYDITHSDLLRACQDELIASGLQEHLTQDELMCLAEHKLRKFKNFMRPLFQ